MENIFLDKTKKEDPRDLPLEGLIALAQAQALQNIAEALIYDEEGDDDYFI